MNIKIGDSKCSTELRGIFIAVLFFYLGTLVGEFLIPLHTVISQVSKCEMLEKIYARLFHFFHFLILTFWFLCIDFLQWFLVFLMIFGNILYVICLSILVLLEYNNYGILFGGIHLILRPWGGASSQRALFWGSGSHWIYMRQGRRKVTRVFVYFWGHSLTISKSKTFGVKIKKQIKT